MAILIICSCKTVYSQTKRICPKCGKPRKDRGARCQVVVREGGRGTCKHTRSADTLSEAREAEQKIRNQLDNNINSAAARKGITLGEIFRRYIALAQDPHAVEHKSSWRKDDQRWRDYLAAAFDNRRVDAISREDILEFLKTLENGNPASASRLPRPLVGTLYTCCNGSITGQENKKHTPDITRRQK